jgi:type IV pilus assembly protein PilV
MKSKLSGFSMIEVLISLVVISTALLGTAGLQLYAMRMTKGGEFRTQAVFLAADIGERMEANKLGAVAGNYAVAATSSVSAASTCSNSVCSSGALAAWDISQWESAVVASGMPQANWLIVQSVAGNPSTYTITINWADRASTTASRTPETFSFVATKTIGLPST